MTEAKHTPGPPQVSDPTPRWWWCDTHGPGTNAAWGCPECVREMRAEIDALRKDAERCRWLLAMFEERRDGWWLDATKIDGAPSLETLRDAIDAAMATGGKA